MSFVPQLCNTTKKKYLFILALCWCAYVCAYLGRLNYAASIPALLEATTWSKTAIGFMGTLFFCTYGFGQLFSGVLGDRIVPSKMIFCGLFLSGLSNFLLSFATSLSWLYCLWGINGLAQSMIWSPLVRFLCIGIDGEEYRQKALIHIATSVPVGTLCAYLLAAFAISQDGWTAAFLYPSLLMMGIAFLWLFLSRQVPFVVPTNSTDKNTSHVSLMQTISLPLLLIIIVIMAHGALKDGVSTWVPVYLQENFFLSSVHSILFTTVLPIINLLGVYLASWINRKHNNEVRTSLTLFWFSFILLVLFWFTRNYAAWSAVIALSLITTMMMGVNTMLINLYPLRYSTENRVSTIAGLLNSFSCLGIALSCSGFGLLVDWHGWSFTIISWMVINTIGLLICLLYKKFDSRPNS